MHSRLKSFERRLARLAALVGDAAAEADHEQNHYRARQVFAALISEGLRRAGLDPAEAVTLRRFDKPPPPPPRLRLRPADPREVFLADAQRLADRLRGCPPLLARASPMELFAYYCLGDGATTEGGDAGEAPA